jgi:Peptidase family M28
MKNRIIPVLLLSFLTITVNHAQTVPAGNGLRAITSDAIRAQLGFLASDWTEGREAGEKGAFMAADYIASILQLYGVKPAGDATGDVREPASENRRSYFQNFVLLKTLPAGEQILKIRSSGDKIVKTTDLTDNVDFIIMPSDPAVEYEAPVVFAGYGYKNDSLKYNDLSKPDLKGKFILKVAGFPKFAMKNSDREKVISMWYAMESVYREMGIAGILEFDPESSVVGKPEIKEFTEMSPSEWHPSTGRPRAHYSLPGKKIPENIIRVTISARVAYEILKGSGIDPDDYIKKADRNEKYPVPALTGKSIYLKTSVKTTQVAVRNVLGMIEGKEADKYIVVGAHYDHIGTGNGYIWNGADDNGSGTVGVMTLAKALMATGEQPEYSIIFAFWTAEEEGLLGSRYYVRNPDLQVKNLRLNMNFDMISRYISDNEPKKVTMTYTLTNPGFRDITANNLKKYGIDLLVDYQPSADPPGGTDHRSFVEAGIPVIRFKPGHRQEYHTPGDEVSTVNWDIMEKIIRISFADLYDLAYSKW